MENDLMFGVVFIVTAIVSFLVGLSFGKAEGRLQGIDYALNALNGEDKS